MAEKSNITIHITGANPQIYPSVTEVTNNFYGDKFAERKLNESNGFSNDQNEEVQDADGKNEELVQDLLPIFFNDRKAVEDFIKKYSTAKPIDITAAVKNLVKEKIISGLSSGRTLWTILKKHNIYPYSETNWNKQIKA